jgi:hypothetical protein
MVYGATLVGCILVLVVALTLPEDTRWRMAVPFIVGTALLAAMSLYISAYRVVLTEDTVDFCTLTGKDSIPITSIVSTQRVKFRVRKHHLREGLRLDTSDGREVYVRPIVADWQELEKLLGDRMPKSSL